MADLQLVNMTKRYDDFVAVDDVSLAIEDGEFVTLLGPSGCGKTTILRTIAGFLRPDAGALYIGGRLATDIPANKRRTAMCFQSYALFPHMSVRENIRFGLRMQKLPADEQERRLSEAVDMVGLHGLESRRPAQLSGGQQQRVSLARAVATHPDILLFDEPLSNLDAKLREHVRVEIKELQRRLRTTSLYVTHDQAEALMISDRIVVMNAGRIEQIGDPETIYRRPSNSFVADFIGVANVIEGQPVASENGATVLETEIGRLSLSAADRVGADAVLVSWRPEEMVIFRDGMENRIDGVVRQSIFMGNLLDLFIEVKGRTIRAQMTGEARVTAGEPIALSVPRDRIHPLG
ncbi:ABC transporter ATP-binding protein [Bauldia sp.]|uniref:ABC transporter ATP-binding protein n=1 Tax=Bauldia sp. TaxID=2575872 RepID=UPI003BAB6C8D